LAVRCPVERSSAPVVPAARNDDPDPALAAIAPNVRATYTLYPRPRTWSGSGGARGRPVFALPASGVPAQSQAGR
jgi:hypothetical protein